MTMPREKDSPTSEMPAKLEDCLSYNPVTVFLLVWYVLMAGAFLATVVSSYKDRLRALLSALGIDLP